MVQVQGVIRTPGGAFALVMPFFEHDEFRDYMKTLTLSGVAAYMRSLLTALAHVHAEGVIHRDIKPRNFMYSAKSCEGERGEGRCVGSGVCTAAFLVGIRGLRYAKLCSLGRPHAQL